MVRREVQSLSMTKVLCSILLLCCSVLHLLADNLPKADPRAEIVCGNARFTVLTSRMIRMEWACDGIFEDRASLTIVNRKLPVPEYSVEKSDTDIRIVTDDISLEYSGQNVFSRENLKVSFFMNGNKVIWRPGDTESGNLMGTIRTLDGCLGFDQVCRPKDNDIYDKGILSKDGWAVIDESERHLFQENDSDWKSWVSPRPSSLRKDMYIFAYGHDYKGALGDFVKVAGKIPLPPKYMFGYWWSRYWQYSDVEILELLDKIRSLDIPLDVMVLDMDWHDTYTLRKNDPVIRDEFRQRIGWTGYTWKKQLFPDPSSFLAKLHDLDVKTSLNLHPAAGIYHKEECYDAFVADYLSRTDKYDGPAGYVKSDGTSKNVPFRICQQEWADAYFNTVIHPLEEMGVDFWWLDWQQWSQSRYVKGLSNTFWLNHTFFNDKLRNEGTRKNEIPRPVIYHRWGGLGSHRYQVGFSGDTYALWSVLEFLPYFTATSSNVGYVYWGHDIGGHQHLGSHLTDPEMYTRWLQYGVFTPIFKTHSAKNLEIERRIWMFPEHFDAMRDAVRLRYNLSPYIYTAARASFDTGVGICRPLYYDYPEEPKAYTENQEFMFGDDILATVLCQPMDTLTRLTERKMWFPGEGEWYDMATGMIYQGGSEHVLRYTIDENPYYLKAGAIIPMASDRISSLQEKTDEYCLVVAPGDGRTTTLIYEDDGQTQAYEDDYALTYVEKVSDASSFKLVVSPRKGSYKGMDRSRKITVRLEGVYAPESVKVNGKRVSYSGNAGVEGNTWTYSGKDLSAIIFLDEMMACREIRIECSFDDKQDRKLLRGKKGVMNRALRLTPALKLFYAQNVDPYMMLPDEFLDMSQCSSFITEDPENAEKYLKTMDTDAACNVFCGVKDSEPVIYKMRKQFEIY